MKYFVFSDVHGKYDKLMDALSETDYDKDNENHYLISLGDNFDRGSQSAEILEFLINTPRIHLLLGNHEVFLLEFLLDNNRDMHTTNYIYNGMAETLESLTGLTSKECDALFMNDPNQLRKIVKSKYPTLIKLIESMQLVLETKTHILVHASLGIYGNLDKLNPHHALWDMDTIRYDYSHLDKKVVFGHTHAWRNRNIITGELVVNNTIFEYENKVSIDGCTNFEDGIVNIYEFEEQ